MNEEKPYNLEPHVEAALSYIPGVGLAIIFIEKEISLLDFMRFSQSFFG